MKTRNGKIARLPRAIRDQLNQRLDDGEPGTKLIRWLNRLPEVQHVAAEYFEGQPVTAQNLSEWRAGGFSEWLTRQEALEHARELAADADEFRAATLSKSGDHLLSDHLATLLTIRCAKVLNNWEGENHEELSSQLHTLRGMAHDIASLARVSVERQRLDLIREKSQAELVDLFGQWVEIPEVRDVVADNRMDPEERKRIIAEIYGRTPPEAEPAATMNPAPEAPAAAKGRSRQAKAASVKPPKPAQPAQASKVPQYGPVLANPLKSKSGRKRWLKDPTACDRTGRQAQLTTEERRREIRRIYGLPEEAPPGNIQHNTSATTQESNMLPHAIPSPLNGERAGVRGGSVQNASPNTKTKCPNPTESDLIKPIDADSTTQKERDKAEADRRWRIQHGFESEAPPASEVQPPAKPKT